MATQKGGYDCDFVNVPPSNLECTICLLTLREPHVISCCGNHFCRPCIERVQKDKKPCPLCNDPNFTVLLHKGVVREVNALPVRCPQKELGCKWEGELGQLQQHLNQGAGLSESGCGFVEVLCVYKCGGRFLRREVREHESEICPSRPVEVVMASILKRLDALTAENQAIKAKNRQFKVKLAAIKKQEVILLREGLAAKAELKNEIARLKDGLAANKTEVTQLKSSLATKAEVTRLNDVTTKELKLCAKKQDVDVKCSYLENRLTPLPPFYFTMHNYEHYKKVDYAWHCNPFYTHLGGYKMLVAVYANGDDLGKGTHLSLYVCIMRGENDDKLQWPFHGILTIQTYNRKTGKWDNEYILRFDDSVPVTYGKKPARNSISNGGWGFPEYISHNDMRCYVEEGIIRFRIFKVDL